MLQKQTVTPQLVELLINIMEDPLFQNFNLVGGTSLALQIGHRNSIDLDLFGNDAIDSDLFLEKLSEYGTVQLQSLSKNIFVSIVNNVKVDFVNYRYPFIDNILVEENIRMASKKDIAAMKLNAIAGRGSKKDFIDLFYLLQEFKLIDLFGFYNEKFQDGSLFLVEKSLTYFEEAEEQPEPKMFDADFTWQKCKQKIIDEVRKL